MLNVQAIRTHLWREREEMLKRAETPVETGKGDDADLAAMSQNKARALWLANDARERLEAIEKALGRIERGTYGACTHCGKPIPEERLHAMPLTLYCVACQGQRERKLRH
jgi:DnaK suppressor protein